MSWTAGARTRTRSGTDTRTRSGSGSCTCTTADAFSRTVCTRHTGTPVRRRQQDNGRTDVSMGVHTAVYGNKQRVQARVRRPKQPPHTWIQRC